MDLLHPECWREYGAISTPLKKTLPHLLSPRETLISLMGPLPQCTRGGRMMNLLLEDSRLNCVDSTGLLGIRSLFLSLRARLHEHLLSGKLRCKSTVLQRGTLISRVFTLLLCARSSVVTAVNQCTRGNFLCAAARPTQTDSAHNTGALQNIILVCHTVSVHADKP